MRINPEGVTAGVREPAGISRALDRALCAFAREVRLLSAVTPSNAREVRERLALWTGLGPCPEPAFSYAPSSRTDLLRALEAAAAAIPLVVEPPLAALYLGRVEEMALEARMAEHAGTPELGALARQRYAAPRPRLAARADEQAAAWREGSSELSGGSGTGVGDAVLPSDADAPGALLYEMRRAVHARRLPFRVETSAALHSRAATGERTIWIARGLELSPAEVHRVVVHEVLGHAAPRALSAFRPTIFQIGTARGADEQEGYALLAEERAGALDAERRRELAARHVTSRAMDAGATFSECARALVADWGLSVRAALSITERAFRGSSGAWRGLGREEVYLPAWIAMRERLAESPADEPIIASGQVSLDSVEALRPLAPLPARSVPPWSGAFSP